VKVRARRGFNRDLAPRHRGPHLVRELALTMRTLADELPDAPIGALRASRHE